MEKKKTWKKNSISVVTYNAAVMVGTTNGFSCPGHLVNLAAKKAAAALPVQTDELLT